MSDSDETNTGEQSRAVGNRIIGRKSWVSYAFLTVFYVVVFVLGYRSIGLVESFLPNIGEYAIWFLIGWLLLYVYQASVLWSYYLVMDEEGIWLSFGVLPWKKGKQGIRWQDVDVPVYYVNFIGPLTNSYTMGVRNKHTNHTDLKVHHVGRGRDVCNVITSEMSARSAGLER